MSPTPNGAHAPYRPWARMKRKVALPGAGPRDGGGWLYLTSNAAGRDHATRRVDALDWPQGCDQSRGLKPTTLYLCGTCVGVLCAAGGVPVPGPGE